jgi:hypothetical protein
MGFGNNPIKIMERARKIRAEAERIDPFADWDKAPHPWAGEGLSVRQLEACAQAKMNLKIAAAKEG